MAIQASIEISQGADPSVLIVTDTTLNEGDESYTNRTLTILDSNDEALDDYPNPISFSFGSYPDDFIEIEGFTSDKALSISMTLTPAVVDPDSVYTVSEDVAMNRFLQQGLYNIQKARFIDNDLPMQAGSKAQSNSIDIIIEQQNSQTAVLYGALVGAQEALDRGQVIINNQIL